MTLQVFKVLTLRKRKCACTGAVPGRFTHGKQRYLPNGPAHEEPGPHWKTGDVHLHFLTEKENARIS